MAKFLKLDMMDEDDTILSETEAESLDQLTQEELENLRKDDRLSPCFGYQIGECLHIRKYTDHQTITWAPGDGGEYVIVLLCHDTEAWREFVKQWQIMMGRS